MSDRHIKPTPALSQNWRYAGLQDAPLHAEIPLLSTERTILRAPKLSDWEAMRTIYMGARARYFGGPFTEEDGWLDWCQLIAGWILRGFGGWTLCQKSNDAPIGTILIAHEMGDEELELGWFLTKEGEGQGFAREAAKAALHWAFQERKLATLVSYIDPENQRSIRLAEALGGQRDAPASAKTRPNLVYRYMPES